MCRMLGVAPSGYYAWLKNPLSARSKEDARLLRLIRASFKASQDVYGVLISPLLKELESLRIAVIDDDLTIRKILEKLLSNVGFTNVVVFDSCVGALEAFQSQSFDVIIADVQMPEINGLELIRRIRSGEMTYPRDTRAIVITSLSSPESLETSMSLDVDGFLPKPFTAMSIVKAIMIAICETARDVRAANSYTSINTNLEDLTCGAQEMTPGPTAGETAAAGTRMRTITQLVPGMRLAQAVRTDGGPILLQKDFELTESKINRLIDLRDALATTEFQIYIDSIPKDHDK